MITPRPYVKVAALTAGRVRCAHTLLTVRETLTNAPLVGLTEEERYQWDEVINSLSVLLNTVAGDPK